MILSVVLVFDGLRRLFRPDRHLQRVLTQLLSCCEKFSFKFKWIVVLLIMRHLSFLS